ncbi:ABC transporter ATP-binding protein [Mucilaginibacter panaciglaebae]|uniref:ABC transporter ATP-binding protein n=1 Tax=Mucilaginibacter panaciglaebae TaxID=502331 RepID=A0ABP7W8Z9_9SPHI
MALGRPLAINIEHMGFRYPDNEKASFANLNLEVAEGTRFGLFGPNGAGKTTLMNLMTGVLCPNEGNIKLLGQETGKQNKEVNKLFGFVPQDFSFYQELSPTQNLEFFGAWAGLNQQQITDRTNELLHILGLEDVRNKPVEKFSGGMKRRVNLAIGVIHNPQVLFLDEPTVGVDVHTRAAIIGYLHELNKSGTTLIYTSHQLNEAEDLCEYIAMIDEGNIITQGHINEVLKTHDHHSLEDLFINLTGKAYRD